MSHAPFPYLHKIIVTSAKKKRKMKNGISKEAPNPWLITENNDANWCRNKMKVIVMFYV